MLAIVPGRPASQATKSSGASYTSDMAPAFMFSRWKPAAARPYGSPGPKSPLRSTRTLPGPGGRAVAGLPFQR